MHRHGPRVEPAGRAGERPPAFMQQDEPSRANRVDVEGKAFKGAELGHSLVGIAESRCSRSASWAGDRSWKVRPAPANSAQGNLRLRRHSVRHQVILAYQLVVFSEDSAEACRRAGGMLEMTSGPPLSSRPLQIVTNRRNPRAHYFGAKANISSTCSQLIKFSNQASRYFGRRLR